MANQAKEIPDVKTGSPFVAPSISHLSQVAYLIGYPIAHSSSPFLHESISAIAGTPYRQVLVESLDLTGFLAYLRNHPTTPKFLGSGVTMPHKVAVIPLLDELTPEAAAVGAVNTIFLRQDPESRKVKLIGHNTDTIGVRDAFLNSFVYIINRDESEVMAVLDECRARDAADTLIHVSSLVQAKALEAPALVVSAIPNFTPSTDAERMVRQILSHFLETGKGALLEMCYHPSPDTQIAELAQENGWQVIGGIEAMISQGCAQSQLCAGVEITEKVRSAVRDAVLKKQH
ncbi:hypothetical protein DV736_g6043, partial [Chaetothyriales sp. CBS 134916]